MPLYGVAQAGSNATAGLNIASVVPGDQYTMLAGTETIITGSKSVAFSRGLSPSGSDAGVTFYLSGCAAGTTVDIQGSNQNLDGTYYKLATITPDGSGNGAYSDDGRAAFYRGYVSSFVAGDAPILIAQR